MRLGPNVGTKRTPPFCATKRFNSIKPVWSSFIVGNGWPASGGINKSLPPVEASITLGRQGEWATRCNKLAPNVASNGDVVEASRKSCEPEIAVLINATWSKNSVNKCRPTAAGTIPVSISESPANSTRGACLARQTRKPAKLNQLFRCCQRAVNCGSAVLRPLNAAFTKLGSYVLATSTYVCGVVARKQKYNGCPASTLNEIGSIPSAWPAGMANAVCWSLVIRTASLNAESRLNHSSLKASGWLP